MKQGYFHTLIIFKNFIAAIDEDLKILCKAKEELQNQNKDQNQQLKRLLAEKDQYTKTILNAQSTNNELEQQVV